MELLAEERPGDLAMRLLADRCGLNVATIYSHFPSKAELLRAVITECRYLERLPEASTAPVDRGLPPGPRLARWLVWMWGEAVAELPLWRLVLGEALRGEEAARAGFLQLSGGMSEAVGHWLATLFPELDVRRRAHAARVIGAATLSVCVESILSDEEATLSRSRRLDRRAADVAALVFPEELHDAATG